MLIHPEVELLARLERRQLGMYERIDLLSGFFLLTYLVLNPWLFGATEDWAIEGLNVLAWAAGILLLMKWWLRWSSGALAVERITSRSSERVRGGKWMIRGLAVLTAMVLLFVLISALNARATYYPDEQRFDYHDHAAWLPFSYDSERTWQMFWNFLALAAFFWSLRDWLLHPSMPGRFEEAAPLSLPPRFQTLLWVISINATLLAIVGIFQKLQGTEKLLWLRPTYMGRPDYMFASYAFRGNAGQYLNLAWPVMLGFWWVLREKFRQSAWEGKKVGGGPHIGLLPCVIVTAAAPMIALSRGGTIAGVACLVFTVLIFSLHRRGTWRTRSAILLVAISTLAFGGALAWEDLGPRLRELFKTPYANPNEVYNNARQMAEDYPLFGIGPGAFRSIYQMYRQDPTQPWQAFLHDDWLETRVTFGWVGSVLIIAMLGLVLGRWFAPGGIPCNWEFPAMAWVSIWGCLGHAKFSFPLQVYSIVVLLLAICCILSCLSRPEYE